MSEAWLQQCGELDSSRQSFEFTLRKVAGAGNFSLVSGSDADAEIWNPVAGACNVWVARQMDPGWWLLEGSVSDPDVDVTPCQFKLFAYTTGDWPSEPTSAYIIYPDGIDNPAWLLNYVAYDNVDTAVLTNTKKILASGTCARIVFNLQFSVSSSGPPSGNFDVTITGTRLACPNCAEP